MKNFKQFGVMVDVSRNAVMSVNTLKKFINYLEKMGYDTLELYAEDTYKIENEPYFGYQRGGYSADEIKEIDEYCKLHGIELIPCIQTLAHFTNVARLPHYSDIFDVNDILLIDSDKTYQFLDNIFQSLAKNFSSRKVNIGMDEAHLVGLGKYLSQNGFVNRTQLLIKHLNAVCKIAEKYGFKPHMWSDMFFRLIYNGQYDGEGDFDTSIFDNMPENIELAYWNYYSSDQEAYEKMFGIHKKLNRPLWFAGGAWTWSGFAPNNYFSLKTMKPAMQAVIKTNVDKVLITMWGDNGKECSFFAALPSLYAISEYAKGNFDDNKISEGFEKMFGIPFEDFMSLDLPNYTSKVVENQVAQNSSKIFLYQDCFMGIFDNVTEKEKIDYAQIAEKIYRSGEKIPEFKYVFDYLGDMCCVLNKKMMLGVQTRKLYKSNDKKALLDLTKVYDEVIVLLQKFYNSFRNLWFIENKPFGWEIQDTRLGGLMCRIKCCKERLELFIQGKIDSIPELEEEILDFNGENLMVNVYSRIISRSSICYNIL